VATYPAKTLSLDPKTHLIYHGHHPRTLKGYEGVSTALGCISGDPRRLVSTSEKADLNDGYNSQDGSENDKGDRKGGDRFVRRRVPEGFLPFLCVLFLLSACATFVLLWALGWLPNSKRRQTEGDR